jgi:hypothetical protein
MKTNKIKMEFRWELEHPEECIKEDNPTRPTKRSVFCTYLWAHSVERAADMLNRRRTRYFTGELPGVT